eukprot:5040216-Amphidinium_carterae.1
MNTKKASVSIILNHTRSDPFFGSVLFAGTLLWEVWFLDHNFHENMYAMFKKVASAADHHCRTCSLFKEVADHSEDFGKVSRTVLTPAIVFDFS